MNSIFTFLAETSIVIGAILLLLALFGSNESKPNNDECRGTKNKKIRLSKFVPNVPYTQLVKEIIQFTGPILAENKIKNYPTFKIRYYKNKKVMGVFYGSNSELVIYLKNHDNIKSLVDTVLHEVTHFMQQKASVREFKKYQDYSNQFGYYNNPLEVEARAFAKKHTKACMRQLESKNIIKAA